MRDLDRLLGFLRDFPDALAAHLATAPARSLDFVPKSWEGVPSESLTIRQQLCHLRDIEVDGYGVRFARVLREESPLLPSIDTYALVSSRDYDRDDIGAAFKAFAAARAKTLSLLADVTSSDLNREGEFEGYGLVTLNGLIHFLISHDQQHLAGIQWLLGKYDAQT